MKISLRKILIYGCIIILAILAIGLVCLFLINLEQVAAAIGRVAGALRAIVLGCVMAYLFYPLTRFTEHFLLYHKVKKPAARRLSTAFSTCTLITLIFLFIYFIVPEVMENLPPLIQSLPWMIQKFFNQLTIFLESQGIQADLVKELSNRIFTTFTTWIQGDPLSDLLGLAGRVMDVAKGMLNFIIGIIVMVYLLMSRDQFVGQGKKMLFALCKNQGTCDTILKHLRAINRIFSGFVSGKLLDSLIIGILCGIVLSILNMPYTMIISLIIGITNVIPVFGPFFGAIPSAILLLLTDPGKCIIFIIFIIILQQVDGNIIGPKILGDSTGLSAFWVLFSLLLFNHLMGFWGMLLGVPLFASFYYLVREFINARLRKKDLPEASQDYVNAVGLAEDGSILSAEPKTIQFRPLLQGEDSCRAQLVKRFRQSSSHAKQAVSKIVPPPDDSGEHKDDQNSDPPKS